MCEVLLEKIRRFYETLNINKALFVTTHVLINDIKSGLIEEEYPVCTINEKQKFIDHNARILLITSSDMNELKNNVDLFEELYNINLVLFIDTPQIPNLEFYKEYFNMSPSTNKNDYILQI